MSIPVWTQFIPGSSDVLKKRALVNRVLELAYAPEPIRHDLYSQITGAMDPARTHSPMPQHLEGPSHYINGITGVATPYSIGPPSYIHCPDRPRKKGRPSNSNLQSWIEEQKRNNRQSTDQENPRGGQTWLVADVIASKAQPISIHNMTSTLVEATIPSLRCSDGLIKYVVFHR